MVRSDKEELHERDQRSLVTLTTVSQPLMQCSRVYNPPSDFGSNVLWIPYLKLKPVSVSVIQVLLEYWQIYKK